MTFARAALATAWPDTPVNRAEAAAACVGAVAASALAVFAGAAPAGELAASPEVSIPVEFAEVVAMTGPASGAPDCAPGAWDAPPGSGDAALIEAAAPDPTFWLSPATLPGALASWPPGADAIGLVAPADATAAGPPSLGGASVAVGCSGTAGTVGGGSGDALPADGKTAPPALPPDVLPLDVLGCALLRPGLAETWCNVPAKSEPPAAGFAAAVPPALGVSLAAGAAAVEGVFASPAADAGAGVLKAGIAALMRKR
jgi:hypothetical protein